MRGGEKDRAERGNYWTKAWKKNFFKLKIYRILILVFILLSGHSLSLSLPRHFVTFLFRRSAATLNDRTSIFVRNLSRIFWITFPWFDIQIVAKCSTNFADDSFHSFFLIIRSKIHCLIKYCLHLLFSIFNF